MSGWRDPFTAEARAFFNATGITDSNTQKAVNQLVVSAQANGWWNLCSAIYPMVGGTATTCKFNLKNPLDTDAAFRLTFVNSPTIDSNGVSFNGSNQYADSHLSPASILAANDKHFSCYITTPGTTPSDRIEMGCTDGLNYASGNNICALSSNINGSAQLWGFDETFNASGLLTVGVGFWNYYIDSSNTTKIQISKNGTSTSGAHTNIGSITSNVFIGAFNCNGTANYYVDRKFAFSTIGKAMTTSICSLMYSDIQTFQTSLGRNV